jgi:hypothetical protein
MAMVVRMAIPFKGRHIFLHNLMPQSVRANMSGVRRFRHGAGYPEVLPQKSRVFPMKPPVIWVPLSDYGLI